MSDTLLDQDPSLQAPPGTKEQAWLDEQHIKLKSIEKKIKRTRSILWILAVLAAIGTVIEVRMLWEGDELIFWGALSLNVFLILCYALSALFVGKFPRVAVSFALAIFILTQALILIGDPAAFFKTLVWKALIFMGLLSGVINAFSAAGMKKELEQIEGQAIS